jgi:hypothetical protein
LLDTSRSSGSANARDRLPQRVAEEARDAAKLEHQAESAAVDPKLRRTLIGRAIECLRRAKSLESVLGALSATQVPASKRQGFALPMTP